MQNLIRKLSINTYLNQNIRDVLIKDLEYCKDLTKVNLHNSIDNILKNKKVSVVSKLIFTEILVSYDYINLYGGEFSLEDCYIEITYSNRNLIICVYSNTEWFESYIDSIERILNNPRFRVRWRLQFKLLETSAYIYGYFIATSLLNTGVGMGDGDRLDPDSNPNSRGGLDKEIYLIRKSSSIFLARTLYLRSIRQVSTLLSKGSPLTVEDVTSNFIKLSIILSQDNVIERTYIRSSSPTKTVFTDTYLRLTIPFIADHYENLNLKLLNYKPQLLGNFILGHSTLSLYRTYTKPRYQLHTNLFNLKILLNLSQVLFKFNPLLRGEVRDEMDKVLKNKYSTDSSNYHMLDIRNIIRINKEESSLSLEKLINKLKFIIIYFNLPTNTQWLEFETLISNSTTINSDYTFNEVNYERLNNLVWSIRNDYEVSFDKETPLDVYNFLSILRPKFSISTLNHSEMGDFKGVTISINPSLYVIPLGECNDYLNTYSSYKDLRYLKERFPKIKWSRRYKLNKVSINKYFRYKFLEKYVRKVGSKIFLDYVINKYDNSLSVKKWSYYISSLYSALEKLILGVRDRDSTVGVKGPNLGRFILTLKEELYSIEVQGTSLIKKLKELEEDFQESEHLIYAYKSLEIGNSFYIAHYYDFRGRIYPHSPVHPMYNKNLRLIIELDRSFNSYNLENSRYYRNFNSIPIDLTSTLGLNLTNEFDTFIFKTILLELGKINKTKLISKTNGLSLKDFIGEGLKILTNREYYFTSLEDRIALLKYRYELEHFKKFGYWNNFTVNRDSTASSIQHWAILLKPRPNFDLSLINLSGCRWYDTYTVIIDFYFKTEGGKAYHNDLSLSTFISRKYLKSVIMTINYNSTFWRCKQYYFDSITKDYPDISPVVEEKLESFLIDFYEFVQSKVFLDYFVKNRWEFCDTLGFKVENDYGNVLFHYLKLSKDSHESIIKIGGIRWKFTENLATNVIDVVKSERAFPANLIHFYDSNLPKYLVENKLKFYSIHDSFGVSIGDLGILMDLTNEFFIKGLDLKTIEDGEESIFILL